MARRVGARHWGPGRFTTALREAVAEGLARRVGRHRFAPSVIPRLAMARPAPEAGLRPGIACRLLGHRMRFRADGATMHWRCERDCGASGQKTYGSVADASLYARALDREDQDDLGKRSPLSLFVLRLARRRRA